MSLGKNQPPELIMIALLQITLRIPTREGMEVETVSCAWGETVAGAEARWRKRFARLAKFIDRIEVVTKPGVYAQKGGTYVPQPPQLEAAAKRLRMRGQPMGLTP